MLTISNDWRLCGDAVSTEYVPLLVEGIKVTSLNIVSDALRLLTDLPSNLETSPAAPNPVGSAIEKFKVSPTL